MKIYLDYAATTPVDQKVLNKMLPYFKEKFGNPMTIHSFGQEASEAVEKARTQVANFLSCDSREVIFTSGATGSNNLAIKGLIKKYYLQNHSLKQKPHIITTQFEHHCVLDSCKTLEKQGMVEVTYLPVNSGGVVKVKDVEKAIKSNTILISIMYVNNEIGTVQPIKEIGKLVKKAKNIYFHTDAVQAINYFDCDVKKLNVNLLSLSAHKIYGPKGVGILYKKVNTPLSSIMDGGGQEQGLRSGTHNVPGIVGLGEAIQQVKSQSSKVKNIVKLRDYLIKRILKEIPGSYLNGSKVKRSPNNANFRFDSVEGESLLMMLQMEGVSVGTGSACSSGSLQASHVLLSLGIKQEQSHGSLRLTLGKQTTKKEIDYTINKLKQIITRLRKISGDVLKEFK